MALFAKKNFFIFRNPANVNLILCWKERSPLNYTYIVSKTYGTMFSKGDSLLVVIIPFPSFIHTSSIMVDGFLTCYENTNANQIVIPAITLEASDITNDTMLIKKSSIIAGDENSILALMVASENTKLFLYMNHRIYTTIENLLEVNCNVRRIFMKDLSQCENLFCIGETLDCFNGAILQTVKSDVSNDNIIYVNIYTR